MRNLFVFALALCVLAVPSLSRAQGKQTDWGNLALLQADQKIQVIDASHKKHSGTFSSFSSQSIILHQQDGDRTIARADVLRVTAGSHRKRNTLLGLAIGAGAGAGIGAGVAPSPCGSSTPYCIEPLSRGASAGIGAAVGGAIGAIVGLVIPSHKTIYRAQP
jgi:hypothetical protein